MHSDNHGETHHKPKHLAEKVEGLIPMLMLVAIVILGAALVWAVMSGDGGTPSYLR
jgi:hypothetical protein